MDILAGILELIGIWLIGKKMWQGFLIFIVGAVIWIYIGITHELYGLIIVCGCATFLNIKNIKKWRKDDKEYWEAHEYDGHGDNAGW